MISRSWVWTIFFELSNSTPSLAGLFYDRSLFARILIFGWVLNCSCHDRKFVYNKDILFLRHQSNESSQQLFHWPKSYCSFTQQMKFWEWAGGRVNVTWPAVGGPVYFLWKELSGVKETAYLGGLAIAREYRVWIPYPQRLSSGLQGPSSTDESSWEIYSPNFVALSRRHSYFSWLYESPISHTVHLS